MLENLCYVKRRASWRLGRWTAKRAVLLHARMFNRPLGKAEIEIVADVDGAPEVLVGGRPAALRISISHSGGVGFCVVTGGDVGIGCDVEAAEERSARFVADYFTSEEAETVTEAPPEDRATLATLIWSSKESALKALRKGLSKDTRSVAVRFQFDGNTAPDRWNSLHVDYAGLPSGFYGWWRKHGDLVFTLVAGTPIDVPLPLKPDAFSP